MEEKARGNAAFGCGNFDEAFSLYSAGIERVISCGEAAVLEDRTALPILFSNRSKIHLDAQRLEDALSDAEAAVALDPLWGKAFARRGQAHLALASYTTAISDLKMAERLDPKLKSETRSAIAVARSHRSAAKKCRQSPPPVPFDPNDKLKAQIAAQRRLCALYVYRFTVPSAGPGSAPKLIEFAASILHPSAKTEIKRQFQKASSTGDPEAVYCLFLALCQSAKFIETEGKSFEIKPNAIKEQLTEEFGIEPNANCCKNKSALNDTRGMCRDKPVRSNPPLHVIETSMRDGRLLFPAGPEWLRDLDSFYDAMIAGQEGLAASFPRHMVSTVSHHMESQRRLDKAMYLLQDAYKLRRDEPMSVAEHKKIYAQCGYRVDTRESNARTLTYDELFAAEANNITWNPQPDHDSLESIPWPQRCCEYCAAPLLMDSPAECACGEPYCSDECHCADWPSHKSTCELVLESIGSAVDLTKSYWNLVIQGALPSPIPGRVDFVRRFQEGVAEGALTASEELMFYIEYERPHLAEIVGVLQDHYREVFDQAKGAPSVSDDDDDDEAEEQARQRDPVETALHALLFEILLQRSQMSVPLPRDSIQRLLFKKFMLPVYQAIADNNPVIAGMGPFDMKEVEHSIDRRIQELMRSSSDAAASMMQRSPLPTAHSHSGRMDLRQMFYNL